MHIFGGIFHSKANKQLKDLLECFEFGVSIHVIANMHLKGLLYARS